MFKRIYFAGIAAYLLLLFFSIIFYKERIVLIDSAFYLFEMVRTGDFSIQHFRFVAVLIEWLPVLAARMSLSLDAIILLYSSGIILYHLACYLICGLVFKNYRTGVALLLFSTLFMTHTFYWTISELIQGLVLMFPLLAWISNDHRLSERPIGTSVVFLLLIPTLAFAHPLLIFPYFFALAYLYLHKELNIPAKALLLAAILFISTLIIKSIFFKEQYDSGAIGNIKNFVRLVPNYFDIHSNRVFIQNWFSIYYWIPLCSIAIITTYVLLRQSQKLMLFGGAMVGYIMLVNVSYPGADVPEFYKDNLYVPVALFIVLPLVFDVLLALAIRNRALAYALTALITVTGLVRMYQAHEPYTTRINWQRQYIAANEGRSIIAHERYAPMDTLWVSWATPYEFWLVSTSENKRTASILFSEKPEEVAWAEGYINHFVTPWGLFHYDSLDKRYFKFPDPPVPYEVIP